MKKQKDVWQFVQARNLDVLQSKDVQKTIQSQQEKSHQTMRRADRHIPQSKKGRALFCRSVYVPVWFLRVKNIKFVCANPLQLFFRLAARQQTYRNLGR